MFHAELRIGDSMVMVGVGSKRSMPASMIIYVPNADETPAMSASGVRLTWVPATASQPAAMAMYCRPLME